MAKYVKYAIGEILLVVIGILIALAINNWNDARKDRKSELRSLVDLHNEFSSNVIVFDSILGLKKDIQKEQEHIIEVIGNILVHDSLKPNRRSRTGAVTFDPSQSVINSLLRTAKIDLIKNDSLKYMLTNWSDLLIDYKEDEQWHTNFTQRELYPYETKNLSTHFYKYHPNDGHRSPFYSSSEVRSLYHKAFKDDEYRNLLLRNHQYLTMTIEEGDRIMKAMQHIITSLSNEIRARQK
ncbi:MAG: DUF6090 family protein [Bacteroidota bacterium]